VKIFRAFLLFFLLTSTDRFAASSYTQGMYRRALGEEKGSDELVIVTTAPPYVLITLQESHAHSSRIVAIAGQSLLDAVAIEHCLPDNNTQWRKRFQIAVAQPERLFSFSSPKARRIARPAYTPAMLNEVRQVLSTKSRSDLIRELKANTSSVHSLYESKSGSRYWAYQGAIAHICLEKGILVATGGCYGNGLGVIDP
jgi:hypothetical protein